MTINVSTNLDLREAEVLRLAPVERSHLLERLIARLDSDPEVVEAWEREADRREAARYANDKRKKILPAEGLPALGRILKSRKQHSNPDRAPSAQEARLRWRQAVGRSQSAQAGRRRPWHRETRRGRLREHKIQSHKAVRRAGQQ